MYRGVRLQEQLIERISAKMFFSVFFSSRRVRSVQDVFSYLGNNIREGQYIGATAAAVERSLSLLLSGSCAAATP